MVVVFFVTSADSGALVVDMLASSGQGHSPLWQRIFWSVCIGAVAIALLLANGLKALQTMTLITALPFAVIMLFMAAALMKGLVIDYSYYQRSFAVSTVPWSGRLWKQRLKQIVTFKDRRSAEEFIIIKIRRNDEHKIVCTHITKQTQKATFIKLHKFFGNTGGVKIVLVNFSFVKSR